MKRNGFLDKCSETKKIPREFSRQEFFALITKCSFYVSTAPLFCLLIYVEIWYYGGSFISKKATHMEVVFEIEKIPPYALERLAGQGIKMRSGGIIKKKSCYYVPQVVFQSYHMDIRALPAGILIFYIC